ncbi:MAG: hypothetical protein AAB787_00050 [Patescibacteria group bacterium]
MDEVRVAHKFLLIPAFLIGAFYFLFTQYAIETIVMMVVDFAKDNLLLIVPSLFFAAIFLVFVFLFYYAARLIEEKLVKGQKNRILEILFYYVIPIGIYLFLRGEMDQALQFFVVVVAILVQQGMEWLFLRMYKKVK